MNDIAAWLQERGLDQYAGTFIDNDIDLDILPELNEQDLEKLGVSMGHRKKLMRAITTLTENIQEPPTAAILASDHAAPAQPSMLALGMERRQLTVMFCDLVGSTALSTRYDPEDLHGIIGSYQSAVAGEIIHFEGHIARFMGDGVMAYYGWPKAQEDAVERAVRAGLAVTRAVATLRTPDQTALAVRVGIATGIVVVGDLIGEGAAQEEAVVGETPNLAARLQALAKPGTVVISEGTRRLIAPMLDLEDLGAQELKGIATLVPVWRVLRMRELEGRFEARVQKSTLLVGREAEFGLVLDRWQRAKTGEGQVVLLSGEAGIGKSRLVKALREYVNQEPHHYVNMQCSPYHTNSALHPIINQLERAASFSSDDDSEQKLQKLEQLLTRTTGKVEDLPWFATLLSIAGSERYPELNLSPQSLKQNILEALIRQFFSLAQQHPLLIVMEDAHLLDPTTRELIDMVIAQIQTIRVLVVITLRAEFNPPSWASQEHVTTLNLQRLSRNQVIEMVDRLTNDKALPQEILNQIIAKTDGIPLFVEELTRTVFELGLLSEIKSRYVLNNPLPELAIPSTLQDSLLARLDRLGAAKEVAQIGAVIGRQFSYDLLAAVSSLQGEALQAALGKLMEAHLIHYRKTPSGTSYTFKHALIQDAAYSSLLRSDRQQLHTRIVALLEEKFPQTAETEPELRAHHYTEAGLHKQAVNYWYKAGRLALRRSTYTESVAHFSTGLQVLANLTDSRERTQQQLELETARAEGILATHGYVAPETLEAYSRARDLCHQLGNLTVMFPVLRGIFNYYMARAEHDAALQTAQECLHIAQEQNHSGPLALAHRLMGQSLFLLGNLTSAREHLQQAIVLYDPEQHRSSAELYGLDLKTAALEVLAPTLCLLGYPEQARIAFNDMLQQARQLAYAFNHIVAINWGYYTCILRQDYQQALELAENSLQLANEHELSEFITAQEYRILAKAYLGEYSKAGFAEIKQRFQVRRARGDKRLMTFELVIFAKILADADQESDVAAVLDDAFTLTQQTDERWNEAELYRIKAHTLLKQDAVDNSGDAEKWLRQSLVIAEQQQARWWQLRAAMCLAKLYRDQGKQRAAYEVLAPVYLWFTEGFDTVDLIQAKQLLSELA